MARLLPLISFLLAISCGIAGAQDAKPGADVPAANPDRPDSPPVPVEQSAPEGISPEQLKEWIQNLSHQRFATRQTASRKLVEAGVPGMKAVAEAAKTDDLEVATRCLAVLTEGLNSNNEAVRNIAKSALESLSKSENTSVAQKARLALETPRELPAIPDGLPPGAGQNRPAQMVRQIRFRDVNGVREITVVENRREIVIKDTKGKDISVTVTETINGKKLSETSTGKDADDLKNNSLQAYALYKRYTSPNANGGIKIQMGGNIFGGNALLQPPAARQMPRIINPLKAADLLDEVEKLRQKLAEANGRLEKAANSEKPDTAELKKISDEIKSTIQRLAEIRTESQLP